MRFNPWRTLSVPLLIGTLLLAGLAGCAPEEDSLPITKRPKAKVTPTPLPTAQTSQGELDGGIKDKGGTSTTAPTNPPPPEPTPLPKWTPAAPPSLPPIIIPPSSDPTDPDATPTPETIDPSADPANP